jgi:two-component system NarL family sensor kinase
MNRSRLLVPQMASHLPSPSGRTRTLRCRSTFAPLVLAFVALAGSAHGTGGPLAASLQRPSGTFWFYLLAGLGAGLGALGVQRLRARQSNALLQALAADRRRLAYELHDTLAQGLAASTLHLQAALSAVDADGRARQHIQRAQALMTSCLADARRAVWGLRPQALEELSLIDALRRLAEEWMAATALEIRLESQGLSAGVPARVQNSVFRVVQEALTNAVKYSRAREVRVWLGCAEEELRVVVEDDGCGFAGRPATVPAADRPHLGLPGMRDRIEELGGRISIGGRPGQTGAVVDFSIPLS